MSSSPHIIYMYMSNETVPLVLSYFNMQLNREGPYIYSSDETAKVAASYVSHQVWHDKGHSVLKGLMCRTKAEILQPVDGDAMVSEIFSSGQSD